MKKAFVFGIIVCVILIFPLVHLEREQNISGRVTNSQDEILFYADFIPLSNVATIGQYGPFVVYSLTILILLFLLVLFIVKRQEKIKRNLIFVTIFLATVLLGLNSIVYIISFVNTT